MIFVDLNVPHPTYASNEAWEWISGLNDSSSPLSDSTQGPDERSPSRFFQVLFEIK